MLDSYPLTWVPFAVGSSGILIMGVLALVLTGGVTRLRSRITQKRASKKLLKRLYERRALETQSSSGRSRREYFSPSVDRAFGPASLRRGHEYPLSATTMSVITKTHRRSRQKTGEDSSQTPPETSSSESTEPTITITLNVQDGTITTPPDSNG